MCEANVYLKESNKNAPCLLMESVDIIEPHGNGLRLVDIFGNQKFVDAKIQDMKLVDHQIILAPIAKK